MTTHELIELAVLDTLALLDDEERTEFESAFRSAPPAVQAQIRREQTRFAHIDDLLPSVEPPVDLRARVLAKIRSLRSEDARTHATGRATPTLPRPRRVSRLWRASALGFATAALVLTITVFHMQRSLAEVDARLAAGTDFQNLKMLVGPSILDEIVFDANSERRALTRITDDEHYANAGIVVMYNADDQTSPKVFVKGFDPEPNTEYRLVVLDENNRPTDTFAEIEPTGGPFEQFDTGFAVNANTRIALVAYSGDGRSETLFRTA